MKLDRFDDKETNLKDIPRDKPRILHGNRALDATNNKKDIPNEQMCVFEVYFS